MACWIDWSIIIGLLFILVTMAIITGKYNKSVADFLAANRCAGRYLITISDSIAGLGAITLIAYFEMYYKGGFPIIWWGSLSLVASSVMMFSGWIIYRFRRTRSFTMAQFLEMRYSKKFRVFAGFLAWFSGIINFGIFPAVGARFFIYFLNIPSHFNIFGIEASSFVLIVLLLLMIALFFTYKGGQITVIVTDFFQGTFCNIAFVIIVIYLLLHFDWSLVTEALSTAPEQASLINPFRTTEAQDFNMAFYLIQAFSVFYIAYVWQGNQGYNCSALSPHEARMGKILGTWRILALTAFCVLLPIVAYTFSHHPQFAEDAQRAFAEIEQVENDQLQDQLATPIMLRHIMPTGILGIMGALMMGAFISTHDTYLHSWGSIFVQDVILPCRKKTLTKKQHIILLRLSILFVAIFIFFFSIIFRQTDYIIMFFNITGAIFTGGAGAVIIGGLYWKKGTTLAAWVAMITGSSLAVIFMILRQIHNANPFTEETLLAWIGSKNGVILGFTASVIAILSYVAVSIIARKPDFNMDKLLHRGKYAVGEDTPLHKRNPNGSIRYKIKILAGITSEFSSKDKVIYIATIGWTAMWLAVFIFGTIYGYFFEIDDESWKLFWKYYIYFGLFVSVVTTIWFSIGGFIDLKKMFALLKTKTRDDYDDGTVA